MSPTLWNGATANWNDMADWSHGVPHSTMADALITTAGVYTVTIDDTSSFQVGSLALGAAGATLAIDGSLKVAGDFRFQAGALSLSNNVTLDSGRLTLGANATLTFLASALNATVGARTITNNGAIDALSFNGAHLINSGAFVNNGLIAAAHPFA